MLLSGIEQKILTSLEEIANSLGFEIVKIKLHGGNRQVLEIAVDRTDSTQVTIKDCRMLSNNFSAILDVEDFIPDKYYMEVSSAGVERPLIKLRDFEKFKDREVIIRLHHAINERKKWQGKLQGAQGEVIYLALPNNESQSFQYSNIKSANLVFTEEMFRTMLNKDQIH